MGSSFCIRNIEIDRKSFTCAGMLKNGERERDKNIYIYIHR